FFFSSRRRHTRSKRDWSSDVCSSDLFAGTLLELALAADRSYMLDGTRPGEPTPPATVRLTAANFGAYPMINGLSRLAARFLKEPGRVDDLNGRVGQDLDAGTAPGAGLGTITPDDIDREDEV